MNTGVATRIYILLMVVLPHTAAAQTISTLSPAETTTDGPFMYEVKVIDEFIERFNDAPGSYIRKESSRLLGSDSMITRRRLLRSLFNKAQAWNKDTALFINNVLEEQQLLSFTDTNWYALADCTFAVNGKNVQVPIALHICRQGDAAKWMIAATGRSDIYSVATTRGYTPSIHAKQDFIPTSSHGTNFVYLQQVFSNPGNAASYFAPHVLQWQRTQKLLTLVAEGKATFKYVKNVAYLFYGINGWVFTVSYFKRQQTNSGWLISNLQQMDDAIKANTLTDFYCEF